MKITKYGQSCLKIEINNITILVDPGSYTDKEVNFGKFDAILFTHGQHSDHLDIDLLKKIVTGGNTRVIANRETVDILMKEGITAEVVKDGDEIKIGDVPVKIYDGEHQRVYRTQSAGTNVAYLIDDKLFLPGDSWIEPGVPVEILALAVSAPWLKLEESIDYALKLKPKTAFPVHDANLLSTRTSYIMPSRVLPSVDIIFTPLEISTPTDL